MQGVDPRVAQAIDFFRAAYAVPEIKNVVDSVLFLSGTSGAFWIVSKLLGFLALGIHDALDDSLAVLFAVAYNVALALLFASVIAMAVTQSGKGGGAYVWYKVAGFIFVYVMLKLFYTDRAGKVDEYGLLGYLGGVGAYIFFILKPARLNHPFATHFYDVVYFVMQSGIGRAFSAFAILRGLFGLARKIAQGIIASARWLGARLGRKAVAGVAVFLV